MMIRTDAQPDKAGERDEKFYTDHNISPMPVDKNSIGTRRN
jgi:hypothetical protein